MLPITDITTFSFQEYPEHTSCIIWFGGCNFRCPYCHNPEFIEPGFSTIGEDLVFKFLESRVGLLDGVVLSGGECTLSPDLYNFIKKIKSMGFKVKIDTNGTNFTLMEKLIKERLVDYIALDYKAPRNKFFSIAANNSFDLFEKTLDLAIGSGIPMEVRTTVHTDLLDEDDINAIIDDLHSKSYGGVFYLQNFKNLKGRTLGNISDQKRQLDLSKLKIEKIKLDHRNFS